MDGADPEQVIEGLMWTDLELDDTGKVSINELGRCLRQNGIDISNFMILRIVSDGQIPQHTIDHELFVNAKAKILTELQNQSPIDVEDKKRKFRAHYIDLWREHSHSQDDGGEIPISKLQNVVFAECNPTRELLDALVAIKSDGSESLNFTEFCEMLDNIPKSGIIDQSTLLNAFQTEDVDGSGFLTRAQLYSLLVENGNNPLKKEEVDELMEDCGTGDRFKYTEWVQRVVTIKELSEK